MVGYKQLDGSNVANVGEWTTGCLVRVSYLLLEFVPAKSLHSKRTGMLKRTRTRV